MTLFGRTSRRGILGATAGLTGALLTACGGTSAGESKPAATGKLVELRAHAREASEMRAGIRRGECPSVDHCAHWRDHVTEGRAARSAARL